MGILPLTASFFLLLGRANAQHHPLNQPLATRIATGECSSEDVGIGGTFFPSENRTTVEGEHPYFDIVYAPTFKVVINKPSREQNVLTQCGQPEPTDEQVDQVAPLGSGYTRVHYNVPVQNYSGHGNEHYGYLSLLDVVDRAVSVTSGVVEPCWQKARGCQYPTFGYDVHFRSNADIDQGVHVPLNKDLTALQTAEYIKFFGVFFNKDAEANQLYTNVRNAFEDAGSGYADTPVVAWIEYKKFSNEFWVSRQPYKLDLVVAAGGENFDATVLGDLPGFEVKENAVEVAYAIAVSAYEDAAAASARFFEALHGVDVVIDTTLGSVSSVYDLDDFLDNFVLRNSACSSSCQFMLNQMVLRTDGTVADDLQKMSEWLETSEARPDWAAHGLARKIHNDDSKTYRYFRNIALGETPEGLTAEMCEEELPLCVEGKAQVIPLLGDGKVSAPSDNMLWYIIGGLVALVGIIGCLCLRKGGARGAQRETLAAELS